MPISVSLRLARWLSKLTPQNTSFELSQLVVSPCRKRSPAKGVWLGDSKITTTSTERQKRSQNLAPVLVIISGNSLVFSKKIITSTGFHQCCAASASAPVVVKNQSPIGKKVTKKKWQKHEKQWPKSDRKSPENEKKWSNSFCRTPFAAPWLSGNVLA